MDYLEFLDLQSENTVDVLPNSNEPLNGGDYYSNPIVVRAGIPIGAGSQLTQFLYVSCNYTVEPEARLLKPIYTAT